MLLEATLLEFWGVRNYGNEENYDFGGLDTFFYNTMQKGYPAPSKKAHPKGERRGIGSGHCVSRARQPFELNFAL